VLFTLALRDPSGKKVETVCTAPAGSEGGTVQVSCVPFLGDVANARTVTVTAAL
jgi:hypothetical protein